MTENNALYRISFGRNSHYFTTKDLVGFLATFEQNNIDYFGTFNVEKIADNVIVDDNVTFKKTVRKSIRKSS